MLERKEQTKTDGKKINLKKTERRGGKESDTFIEMNLIV